MFNLRILLATIAVSCGTQLAYATVAPKIQSLVSSAAIIAIARQTHAEVLARDNIKITIEPIEFLKGWPWRTPRSLHVRGGYFPIDNEPWTDELRDELQQNGDRDVGNVNVYFLNVGQDEEGNADYSTLFPVDPWFGIQHHTLELRNEIVAVLSQSNPQKRTPYRWHIVLLSSGIVSALVYVAVRIISQHRRRQPSP